MNVINENIRNIRKEKGFTQKQLASLVGTSQQNLAQYENGKRNPKIETLEKIANALEVPIFHLINGTLEEKLDVYHQTTEYRKGEQFKEGYEGVLSFLRYLYNAKIQEKCVDGFQIYEVVGEKDSFLLTGEEVDYLVDYLKKIVPPIIHLLCHDEPIEELTNKLKANNL